MKSSLWLFVVALALFKVGLCSQEVINFDARFYLFAQEMWRHGPSWFPLTYGQPYPDYPALSTFLIYLSAWIFGGLNKLTVVLPSAIAAALTVVVTYHIGRLHDKKLGIYAVCMLFCTLTFFKSARSISLDMYPTLITAICFYLVHHAELKQNGRVSKWIYPMFILSFLFRGPIGLVMPTGVVCVYYLIQRNFRQFFLTGIFAAILLLLCIAGLLGLAYQSGGMAFVHDVWRMEVAGRMGNYFQPFYFYFINSFSSYALTYPLALLAMIGVLARKNNDKYFMLLTGWVLVIMLGMSIPTEKKVRYILPIVPALALLAASLFTLESKQKYLSFIRQIAINFLFLFPALLCVATAYAWYIAPRFDLAETIPFSPLILLFAILQILNGFASRRKVTFVIVLATVSFILTNIFIIEPIELHLDRTRDFVKSIEVLRGQQHARLGFYRENADEMPIKYLINMDHEETPVFVLNEAELKNLREPIILISSIEYFTALSPEVLKHCRRLAQGQIGHAKVMVFKYEK